MGSCLLAASSNIRRYCSILQSPSQIDVPCYGETRVSKNAAFGLNFLPGFWTWQILWIMPILTGFGPNSRGPKNGHGKLADLDALHLEHHCSSSAVWRSCNAATRTNHRCFPSISANSAKHPSSTQRWRVTLLIPSGAIASTATGRALPCRSGRHSSRRPPSR